MKIRDSSSMTDIGQWSIIGHLGRRRILADDAVLNMVQTKKERFGSPKYPLSA